MDSVNTSKNGTISFNEFWNWWISSGDNGKKLGKLVKLKINAMKLL
jgi:hypothetical protein